jgi:hypothetical protein
MFYVTILTTGSGVATLPAHHGYGDALEMRRRRLAPERANDSVERARDGGAHPRVFALVQRQRQESLVEVLLVASRARGGGERRRRRILTGEGRPTNTNTNWTKTK